MILDPFWSTSLGVPIAYHCFFYRLVIGRVRSRDYLLNGKRQTAVSTSAPNSLNVSAWKLRNSVTQQFIGSYIRETKKKKKKK